MRRGRRGRSRARHSRRGTRRRPRRRCRWSRLTRGVVQRGHHLRRSEPWILGDEQGADRRGLRRGRGRAVEAPDAPPTKSPKKLVCTPSVAAKSGLANTCGLAERRRARRRLEVERLRPSRREVLGDVRVVVRDRGGACRPCWCRCARRSTARRCRRPVEVLNCTAVMSGVEKHELQPRGGGAREPRDHDPHRLWRRRSGWCS